MKKLFSLSASPNLKVYIFDSKRSWHQRNIDEDNKQVIVILPRDWLVTQILFFICVEALLSLVSNFL